MTKLIEEVINNESYQYYPLGDYVVRAIGVCGSRPTFKYTRIEIAGTLDRLAAGESLDDLVTGYGGRVPKVAIVEAIRLARVGWSERSELQQIHAIMLDFALLSPTYNTINTMLCNRFKAQ